MCRHDDRYAMLNLDAPFWDWLLRLCGLIIAGGGAAMIVWKVIRPLHRRFVRWLDWMDTFRESWDGIPADPARPWQPHVAGVMERLNMLDGEFADDGNGSLKSAVIRTEKAVTQLTCTAEKIVLTVEVLETRLQALENSHQAA